jgi:hypothetical protein
MSEKRKESKLRRLRALAEKGDPKFSVLWSERLQGYARQSFFAADDFRRSAFAVEALAQRELEDIGGEAIAQEGRQTTLILSDTGARNIARATGGGVLHKLNAACVRRP